MANLYPYIYIKAPRGVKESPVLKNAQATSSVASNYKKAGVHLT